MGSLKEENLVGISGLKTGAIQAVPGAGKKRGSLSKEIQEEYKMNLINFIVWLSAGAVIGWFASQMVRAERRQTHKTPPDEEPCPETS